MQLSIIIPTLNEAKHIERLVRHLVANGSEELLEIIVIDGGSEDHTQELARAAGARVCCSAKGRAIQMNRGAALAQGDVFYFVHGDTLPLASYLTDIKEALQEGFLAGCYRYKFDSPKKMLKINAYFTRFNRLWCRGGDQSLFVTKTIFEQLQGFRVDHILMEDFEFIHRLQSQYSFRIIPKSMLVSARKYNNNSYWKVQIANLIVFNMYRLGYSQQRMAETYKQMLKKW